MHTYHIQLYEELKDRDFEKRLAFCRWVLQKVDQQRDFIVYVIFGNEATFHKNDCVNRYSNSQSTYMVASLYGLFNFPR